METVRELCKYIGSVISYEPCCVETGCVYVCGPDDEVHTTTNNITEYICLPNNGVLASFDIDKEHIGFAESFVSPKAHVGFFCGDSVGKLTEYAILLGILGYQVSLLCLDSKEFDEDHMVNEFNAIKGVLNPKHFVLVDDIHNPNSVKYKKMVPILKDLGYDWKEISTPTGMFVAAKGYSLEEI